MKSILYVGATLMIGASIYGFVDYKKTSQDKKFTSLYEQEKKPAPVVEDDALVAAVVTEKKQSTTKDDPAIINAVKTDKNTTVKESKETEKPSKPAVKKAKKKKKLDHRIFSRAPLKEEIEEEPLPVPTVEKKKTEEKEQ